MNILTVILQAAGGGGGLLGFMPILLIMVVIYFFMLRPQAKRQKEQKNMLAEVKQGDKIVTIGGIHATVAGVRDQDNTLIIKLNDSSKIIIDRAAVARTVKDAEESA